MEIHRFPTRLLGLCLISAVLAGFPLSAAEFPPVTEEERALTAVPGEPNAPAVVLFKKGEFLMMGFGLVTGSSASHLKVQGRVKILTEAGKGNGEMVVAHSAFTRLQSFEGRTVLPDGRVIPVPADARFVRRTSSSQKTFVTAVAFPSVEPGAILDYQYEMVFKSPFFLEPWYFSETVPVRYSEIVFKTASGWWMRFWERSPFGVKIQQERESTSRGEMLRAWAENLPSVPEDPYGPPYADLATQMMLLPTDRTIGRLGAQSLMGTWPEVVRMVGGIYLDVRRRDAGVAQQARKVAAAGTSRQKAEALYRFVRDKIETKPEPGIFADPKASLRTVLSERRGDPVEKALLLQTMLQAVEIGSQLVWARDRNRGAIDPQLPNPDWFDTVLVGVTIDGEKFFLDPTDRALGFGHLRAGYEGAQALVPEGGFLQIVPLPESPFDQNGRRAEIRLVLDEQGRLSGKGSLRLTGQAAWEKTGWQESEAKAVQAWTEWLAGEYRDFQVSDVRVAEVPDERRVEVHWSMAQREEEVLGDEVTLMPSHPLGPVAQPFVQTASSRKTMVMFDYAKRDEVELRLEWPQGWKAESIPKPANLRNQTGALESSVEMEEGGRSLVYRRRFDVVRRTLRSPQEYESAQSLYGEAEKNDAQSIFLVRR